MSKRPGNSLDFFLSKQTRVENDLSSENELDESLTIAKNKECFEAIRVIAALSYCRNRSRNGYLAMHLG